MVDGKLRQQGHARGTLRHTLIAELPGLAAPCLIFPVEPISFLILAKIASTCRCNDKQHDRRRIGGNFMDVNRETIAPDTPVLKAWCADELFC